MEGSTNNESTIAGSVASSALNSSQDPRLNTSDFSTTTTPTAPTTATPTTTIIANGNNAKQHQERSAVVLALFGRTVGLCVGDFSTTYYHRANGRLYAATHAILFYSNLFGFERRLCLRFSDIETIERYRSTSIKITMVDYEDHIFRKFVNREHVLQLLTDLHDKAMRDATRRVPLSSDLIDLLQQDARDVRSERSATPVKTNTGSDLPSNRRRLTSESSHSDDMEAQAMMVRQRSQSLPSLETLEALQVESQHRLPLDSPSSSVKRRRVFLKSLSSLGSGRTTTTSIRGNADIPEESCVPDSPVASQTFGLTVPQPSSPDAQAAFDMEAAWTNAKVPYSEIALDVRDTMVGSVETGSMGSPTHTFPSFVRFRLCTEHYFTVLFRNVHGPILLKRSILSNCEVPNRRYQRSRTNIYEMEEKFGHRSSSIRS
jgi:GRAM domain